jgi:hypothetical protein
VGVAVGSLALVAIFVVSSGGSDVVQSSQRSPAVEQAGGALGEEARKDLQAQAARFEERLAATPDDLEALEVCACVQEHGRTARLTLQLHLTSFARQASRGGAADRKPQIQLL